MGKKTKEQMALINRDVDELFKLVLKKTGVSYPDFLAKEKDEWIEANLDMVTPTELAQFKHLHFYKQA
jgi:hypothetical protein